MAEDEVRIRITAEADDAIKGLQDVAKGSEKLRHETEEGAKTTEKAVATDKERERELKRLKDAQDETTRSTKGAAEETGILSKLTTGATGAVTGLAAGLLGGVSAANLITKAMQEYNESIQRNIELLKQNGEASRRFAEERLDLVALGGVERPEDVAFLDAAGSFAGRSAGEMARVKAIAKSRLPSESDETINSLVMEIGRKGQQTASPLPDIAGSMITLFQETQDARVASNIMEVGSEQAGEPDPAQFGPLAGRLLAVRGLAGMTPAQAVGTAAGVTNLGIDRNVATTGAEALIRRYRGKVSPEAAAVFEREGINPEGDVIQNIIATSRGFRDGRISREELQAVGGDEGLRVLSALSSPEREKLFLDAYNKVSAADQIEGSVLSGKAQGIMGSSPLQRYNLIGKQQTSRADFVSATDERAARAAAGRDVVKRVLNEQVAKGLVSPDEMQEALAEYDLNVGAGRDPVDAAAMAEGRTSVNWIQGMFRAPEQFGRRGAPGSFNRGITGLGVDAPLEDEVRRVLEAGPQIDLPAPAPTGNGSASPAEGVSNAGTVINNYYEIAAIYGTPVEPWMMNTDRSQAGLS